MTTKRPVTPGVVIRIHDRQDPTRNKHITLYETDFRTVLRRIREMIAEGNPPRSVEQPTTAGPALAILRK